MEIPFFNDTNSSDASGWGLAMYMYRPPQIDRPIPSFIGTPRAALFAAVGQVAAAALTAAAQHIYVYKSNSSGVIKTHLITRFSSLVTQNVVSTPAALTK